MWYLSRLAVMCRVVFPWSGLTPARCFFRVWHLAVLSLSDCWAFLGLPFLLLGFVIFAGQGAKICHPRGFFSFTAKVFGLQKHLLLFEQVCQPFPTSPSHGFLRALSSKAATCKSYRFSDKLVLPANVSFAGHLALAKCDSPLGFCVCLALLCVCVGFL